MAYQPTPEPPMIPEPMPGAVPAPVEPLRDPLGTPLPERRKPWLSPLNQRRWRNFRRNGRAYWSLIVFSILFVASLFAEFIANDKPILLSYRGELRMPIFSFYSERDFGGDFPSEAAYSDIEVQCLIETGGLVDCFDDPEGLIEQAKAGTIQDPEFQKGWMAWPIIPYSYDTIVDVRGVAPSPPDRHNWLGTDDTKRDVLARVIYGFRLSVVFALIVTAAASLIGITAGALQGFFGGWVDLIFQRIIEIWSGTPSLYVIIIVFAILGRSFWLLVGLTILFGWPALVGVVRAEFLRARNFEYVRAARALGSGTARSCSGTCCPTPWSPP
ncbi:Oligopeptide/dipeptide uptake family ABC transporter, permease protein [Rubellimicrobium mesophilum DSM 19309]|uniref:Oligopeptide/dipeptide uptake family ABC transporter, permease protein n=1 Tax=Rubellimicrobium mesophilum DSM 19309 TaxID=442562 RepID=A0A017HL55_9RHOB|nr:Oligopeptide/dipeptide uptake family ABC transporter, permease protein [Rubellimicrobium mesophilum DSM 19309]